MPVLGVIYHPAMDELFVGLTAAAASPPLASDASGSYLNGSRLRADQKASTLSEAMLLTDVGYEHYPNPNPNPIPNPNPNPNPTPNPGRGGLRAQRGRHRQDGRRVGAAARAQRARSAHSG